MNGTKELRYRYISNTTEVLHLFHLTKLKEGNFMPISCVYSATFSNGKKYIGFTKDLESRKRNHLSSSRRGCDSHFYNAIRKHGEPYFRVLQEAPEHYLPELEKWWIRFYNTYEGEGYNMNEGGEGGKQYEMTEDTKRKISESNKGKKCPEEAKKKLSKINKQKASEGRHHSQSPELRSVFSAIGKERANNKENWWDDPQNEEKLIQRNRKTSKKMGEKAINNELPWQKNTAETIIMIRKDYDDGLTQAELCRKYNEQAPYIHKVVKRKIWVYLD